MPKSTPRRPGKPGQNTVGIDVPVEGRRQMAEIDVAADPPLGPQPFDGGVHVDGVPGDDGIRDQV